MTRERRGPRVREIPDGDSRERLLCPECGFISYDNPKLVVGSVVSHETKILLCRRAIEPRRGLWTLPAGYLELHESPEEGAAREAQEEARATIQVDQLLAVFTVAHISQVQMFFRARLDPPGYGVGEESLEVALFGWEEIPWDRIAFETVALALKRSREVGSLAVPPVLHKRI